MCCGCLLEALAMCHDDGDLKGNGDNFVVVIPAHERVTNACMQDRTVCVDCMQQYLRTLVVVARQQCGPVGCICSDNPVCAATLTADDIAKYADRETVEVYQRLRPKDHPTYCRCANEACRAAGQIHDPNNDGANGPMMRCQECNVETCVTHQCRWHEGRTCEEYDREITPPTAVEASEAALQQFLADHAHQIQPCPNCGNGVEKIGGCDRMVCGCGHTFCFGCRAPYRNGPLAAFQVADHQPKCQYRAWWYLGLA
jgi:IBR domain, a half RING-finger domain